MLIAVYQRWVWTTGTHRSKSCLQVFLRRGGSQWFWCSSFSWASCSRRGPTPSHWALIFPALRSRSRQWSCRARWGPSTDWNFLISSQSWRTPLLSQSWWLHSSVLFSSGSPLRSCLEPTPIGSSATVFLPTFFSPAVCGSGAPTKPPPAFIQIANQ